MDEQQAIQHLKKGDLGTMKDLVEKFQTKAIRTACLITPLLDLHGYVTSWR